MMPSLFVGDAYPDAIATLCARDPALAAIVARHGPPPTWARPPGFATLTRLVFEQSVSLASAAAVWDRTVAAIGAPTPENFAAPDVAALAAHGLSRAKALCVKGLGEAALDGRLDLDAIARLPDDAARAALVSLRGIGPWTADVYMLMALGRPDIWPGGDVALREMVGRLDGTPRPTVREMPALGERWRPLRAVATRILWSAYLAGDDLTGINR